MNLVSPKILFTDTTRKDLCLELSLAKSSVVFGSGFGDLTGSNCSSITTMSSNRSSRVCEGVSFAFCCGELSCFELSQRSSVSRVSARDVGLVRVVSVSITLL